MPPPDGVLEFLGLECCAECITGCGCIVRSYGDLICGAMGITIVIVAILYVALDPLDVLAADHSIMAYFIIADEDSTQKYKVVYSEELKKILKK